MKKIIFIILLLVVCNFAFADKLQIDFQCYPKELQAVFAKYGYKLDLRAEDRDKDSWAFLRSEGAKYYILTYYSVTEEDFNIVTKVTWEVLEGIE